MLNKYKQIKILDINKFDVYNKKRNCYSKIADFINASDATNKKICFIYGLLGSGKTILLQQAAQEITANGYKCLYLTCSDEYENMKTYLKNNSKYILESVELFSILNDAVREKYDYICIDEITLEKYFLESSFNVIANHYTKLGLRFIITGSYSYCFTLLANRLLENDDIGLENCVVRLNDIAALIPTSHIPFSEYNYLLGKGSDDYIKFGGTLLEKSPYLNSLTGTEYIDKAVIKNIIRSINKTENFDKHALTLWYSEEDITSAIQQYLNNVSQNFLADILKKHGLPNTFNQNKISTQIRYDDIDRIPRALENIGLLSSVSQSTNKENYIQIISHPGMLYYYTTMQLNLLVNNEAKLQQLGIKDKPSFIEKIDSQLKSKIAKIFVLEEH